VRRLARAAAVVALFGVLSRLLGFVREIVLAGVYGASAVTDAFVNGLFIVNTVAAVLLYTMTTLVIPVFQEERERAGAQSAWRLVTALAVWVGGVLIVLAAAVSIWPEGPAALFNLDAERERRTAELLRIMAPALMLQGFTALLTALLQIHGRFAGPAAIGVAFNFGIIVGVAAGQGPLGIEAAAWGVTLGAIAQVALQVPQFITVSRGVMSRPKGTHARLGAVGLLALPVLGASLLQQVNGFTDRLFAGTLEAGRVSALSFAQALGSAPRTALLFPLLTPLFPLIARFIAERREEDALRAFRRAAGLLGLVAVPLSVWVAIYATELTQLAFKRGRFDAEAVTQTAGPLVFYGLAIWANFIGYLLNRTLAAGSHVRDILVATSITVPLTIGLDLALIGPMEQSGLALASAIAVYANTSMTLYLARRRYPSIGVRALGRQQARIALCGGIAAGAALLLNLGLESDGGGPAFEVAALFAGKSLVALAVFLAAARLIAPAELAEGRRSLAALIPRRRYRPST